MDVFAPVGVFRSECELWDHGALLVWPGARGFRQQCLPAAEYDFIDKTSGRKHEDIIWPSISVSEGSLGTT